MLIKAALATASLAAAPVGPMMTEESDK